MLNLLLKTGTYYVLWQKFRGQLLMLFISLMLIVMILGIYNDLYSVLKITNKDSVLLLLLLKWSLILLIVGVNIYSLKKIKIKDVKESIKQEQSYASKKVKPLTPMQEHVKQKKLLLTKTDFILEKYTNKKSEA